MQIQRLIQVTHWPEIRCSHSAVRYHLASAPRVASILALDHRVFVSARHSDERYGCLMPCYVIVSQVPASSIPAPGISCILQFTPVTSCRRQSCMHTASYPILVPNMCCACSISVAVSHQGATAQDPMASLAAAGSSPSRAVANHSTIACACADAAADAVFEGPVVRCSTDDARSTAACVWSAINAAAAATVRCRHLRTSAEPIAATTARAMCANSLFSCSAITPSVCHVECNPPMVQAHHAVLNAVSHLLARDPANHCNKPHEVSCPAHLRLVSGLSDRQLQCSKYTLSDSTQAGCHVTDSFAARR